MTSVVDYLAPDTVIKRRLEISSTSSEPVHVDVYPGAAAIEHDTFVFAPDRTTNELSGWIRLDHTSVDLPPYGTTEVMAKVAVPPEASSGERYSVIWAQVASQAEPERNVKAINRVGVRLYIDVGPGGEPPSDFQIEELTPARTDDGRPEVLAKVHNTGQRALDLSGTLSLSDGPASMSAGPFKVTDGTTLAPGNSAPVTVLLDHRLPDGPWTVHLTLASGRVQKTATATLTFPTAAGSTGQAVRPRKEESTLGSLVAVTAAGCVAVLFLVARRVRRR
ncbi:peptidase [Kitasatospora sp. GP82]|uniref:peptidase n=1 Tax=Kitasatospora sp. GP82 TaxID=3035089 RepID=UPI0024758C04|nr:peptidase [Kitasatospora sp. GP82]MDH6124623.1 hypothetical protein [Kitasatospora sp. GP82]